MSQRHAELFRRQDRLWIRDLGSTNGTWVNGRRLTDACPIGDGDTVHFGDHEFRLVVESRGAIQLEKTPLDPSLPLCMAEFRQQFLHGIRFKARFQPLVRLDDLTAVGYELFGTGELEGTDWQAPELFQLAASLGREAELGAAFRSQGVSAATSLPPDLPVLINSHLTELERPRRLVDSLESLREHHPDRALVLEIQETGIADRGALARLRSDLEALDVGLAFNDFGSHRSRLQELLEVDPRFVKFDRSWTRDLYLASSARRKMVEGLVHLIAARAIEPVAEGIESEEEGRACLDFGFELSQGPHFGLPSPAAGFARSH